MADPKRTPAIAALIEAARKTDTDLSDDDIVEDALDLATEIWKARAKGERPVFYDANRIRQIVDAKERQRQGGTVH